MPISAIVLEADRSALPELSRQALDRLGVEDAVLADALRRQKLADIIRTGRLENGLSPWGAVWLLVPPANRRRKQVADTAFQDVLPSGLLSSTSPALNLIYRMPSSCYIVWLPVARSITRIIVYYKTFAQAYHSSLPDSLSSSVASRSRAVSSPMTPSRIGSE